MLGHDLRSPVTKLANTLSVWYGQLNTNQKKQIVQVQQELDNVQLILNNLLQWASLQIRDSPPHFESISLQALVGGIIRQVVNSSKEKTITIINDVAKEYVLGDEYQIQIVIRNLLSNALKFTSKGGFVKVLSIYEVHDQTVLLIIRDTGIGMNAQELAQVFNYPISQHGTNGEKGTGIGLSLCKELVEKNHGSIHINSALNKGTEVILKLPIAKSLII